MKRIALFFPFFCFVLSYGQFNESAPWMIKPQAEYKSNITSFKSESNSFENYWKGKDPNRKGSGFKPFKRWENHW